MSTAFILERDGVEMAKMLEEKLQDQKIHYDASSRNHERLYKTAWQHIE